MEHNLPRGLRNNNPLNLRYNPNTHWLGQVENPTDKKFCQFTSLLMGCRAGLRNIRTQIQRNKGLTLLGLIRLWAPDSDGNNSKAYTDFVAASAGVEPNFVLDFSKRIIICSIAHAMCFVENGKFIDFDTWLTAYEIV